MFQQTKLPFFLEERIETPQVYVVGIFGSRRGLTETHLCENILNPILEAIGRVPEKILAPADNSATSLYIEEWAYSLRIPIQSFEADFRSHGKRAAFLRDGRIERECTIAIIFQAPRSVRYNSMAENLARKGKKVFFIDNNSEITELTK